MAGLRHPLAVLPTRLRKTVKRRRTVMCAVMREPQREPQREPRRKLGADQAAVAAGSAPAIEPLFGCAKGLISGWIGAGCRALVQNAVGDALHALRCAAGYSVRWLLRAVVCRGLSGFFYAFQALVACFARLLQAVPTRTTLMESARTLKRRSSRRLPWSPHAALG